MINNYLERQIKENFSYQPTFEQEIAVKSLSEFLLSTANDTVLCFVDMREQERLLLSGP